MKDFNPGEETRTSRRNLPHWQQNGCTYFITFRLADSIPKNKLLAWNEERSRWLRSKNIDPETPYNQLLERLSPEHKSEYYKRFWKIYHDMLDACHGSCALRIPELARIVADALHFFDHNRYQLGDYVIMPNHVHLLVTPLDGWKLEKITHSWKSFTAKEINRKQNSEGKFWQQESYDHIVRNQAQLRRIESYIAKNPAKLNPGEFLYHKA